MIWVGLAARDRMWGEGIEIKEVIYIYIYIYFVCCSRRFVGTNSCVFFSVFLFVRVDRSRIFAGTD
jgi:hypothetical protein